MMISFSDNQFDGGNGKSHIVTIKCMQQEIILISLSLDSG